MDRLITDKPQNEEEAILNYAYAKGGSVYLRYGDGGRRHRSVRIPVAHC
jgi:hypothetical protein